MKRLWVGLAMMSVWALVVVLAVSLDWKDWAGVLFGGSIVWMTVAWGLFVEGSRAGAAKHED